MFVQAVLIAALAASDPSSQAAPLPDYPKDLRFTTFVPCRGNASFCGKRILARGEIDSEAPERLRSLLATFDYPPTIVFDSPGGNVIAGLKLGTMIRERGLSTEVGPEYSEEVLLPDGSGSQIRIISAAPVCLSACSYVFMGGTSRTLLDGGRLGVHQFRGATENGEGTAQSLTSILSQYMLSMGIDRDILDIAGVTNPDDMTLVSHSDAVVYNLDNQSPPQARWELTALDGGYRAVRVVQQLPGSDRKVSILVLASPNDAQELYVMIAVGPIPNPGARATGLSARNPVLCASPGKCMDLIPETRWKYDPNPGIIIGTFGARSSVFAALIRGEESVSLDAGMPNAVSDLSPSLTLGTVGLENALLALY